MSTPVCIRFATIGSGVVLRWYADETQEIELANAGREEARFNCFPSAEFWATVVAAHERIRDAYATEQHQKIDTSRWETHERVGGFMSDKIRPVGGTR